MSDLAFIEHTASAVYHERGIFEVFGEIPAGTEADIQLFSRCLTEEFREFHAADISALPVVSAALGNKNGIAVTEIFDSRRTFYRSFEKTLVSRHEDRK